MFSFKEEPLFPSLSRTSSDLSSFPSISRSSSEQSSGSTGNGIGSKSMLFTDPSLQLQESLTKSLLWAEPKVEMKQEMNFCLDTDSDPPLWDDPKDPGCEWSYHDMTNQLAEKLLIEETERAEYSNPLLSQSDIINPFMLMKQERNIQQLNATIDTAGLSNNPRFKTEICRNYKEKGSCLYGELCQFAHGKQELRKDVVRHNKYKTKLCQKYWIHGYCAYGPRCNFIHQDKETIKGGGVMTNPGADDGLKTSAAPSAPTIWQCKSVDQVLGLASMRKANCGDQGDSGSEEGRTYGSMMGGGQVQARERFLAIQQQYAMARQEDQSMIMDKFPTFVPRSYPGQMQGGNNLNHTIGPVGSGRPSDSRPQGPQRIVWPGA